MNLDVFSKLLDCKLRDKSYPLYCRINDTFPIDIYCVSLQYVALYRSKYDVSIVFNNGKNQYIVIYRHSSSKRLPGSLALY